MKGFKEELEQNILRFWKGRMLDEEFGGFYGKIDAFGQVHARADKGAVMNFRVLWTYAAAYRILGNADDLLIAQRAYRYVKEHFVDPVYGGVYWALDYRGLPLQRKKQLYAQAFAVYAFSEYYRITGDTEALDLAMTLFDHIEACRDRNLGGYGEAYGEDWSPIADMRLSEKDENEQKTMNTHLHIMEAYTNLLRVSSEEKVRLAQKELITVFIGKIYDKNTGHLRLFFDENWVSKSDIISFGHDIEAAWLLLEAAQVLDDKELIDPCEKVSLKIADTALEGVLPDGSLAYERQGPHWDKERHWWVQAEAVVGFMYAADLEKTSSYQQKAQKAWEYIQDQIIDSENGEWVWSRLEDGSVNLQEDKAGFWKCPYHNGRMCLEMIEHFGIKD